MWQKKIKTIFHPERYQGWGKFKKYFEGWYYKVVSADEKKAFAFIPGIAMDKQGKKQAFIQVLDGKKQTAEYIRFPARNFFSSVDMYRTEIVRNIFTSDQMVLNLENIKGELQFSNTVPWPNHWYSPGIMGPYTFVPFMECYHGVLSMDHEVRGRLEMNNQVVDFSGGRGYIEKDWGHSFPSAYIWVQSNHFNKAGTSIKASVAKIPWLGSSFVGFIAGVYYNDKLLQFTTYNKTQLIQSKASEDTVELVMENKKYLLEILVHRSNATELASPVAGLMNGRISESMTSIIDVKVTDKISKEIIFNETGRNTALEVAGDIDEITIT